MVIQNNKSKLIMLNENVNESGVFTGVDGNTNLQSILSFRNKFKGLHKTKKLFYSSVNHLVIFLIILQESRQALVFFQT